MPEEELSSAKFIDALNGIHAQIRLVCLIVEPMQLDPDDENNLEHIRAREAWLEIARVSASYLERMSVVLESISSPNQP